MLKENVLVLSQYARSIKNASNLRSAWNQPASISVRLLNVLVDTFVFMENAFLRLNIARLPPIVENLRNATVVSAKTNA